MARLKQASTWKAPAGFRSGDAIPVNEYRLGSWKPAKYAEGAKRMPKASMFVGRNLVELMLWMKLRGTYQDDLTMHPQQRAWLVEAINAAMTAADSTFRNHYDEVQDPKTNAAFDGPGAGATAHKP